MPVNEMPVNIYVLDATYLESGYTRSRVYHNLEEAEEVRSKLAESSKIERLHIRTFKIWNAKDIVQLIKVLRG